MRVSIHTQTNIHPHTPEYINKCDKHIGSFWLQDDALLDLPLFRCLIQQENLSMIPGIPFYQFILRIYILHSSAKFFIYNGLTKDNSHKYYSNYHFIINTLLLQSIDLSVELQTAIRFS